jgi:DNA primase
MSQVCKGSTSRIDFREVADRTDLRGMIVSACGQPDRNGKVLCPFHDDHSPSLSVSPDGRRFR